MSEKQYIDFKKRNKELILQVCENKEPLLELYKLNYGFLYNYASSYFGSQWYMEDFLQLGYLAIEKAVTSYLSTENEEKYDFIAFYKMWLHHYFFRFNCLMQKPLKIPTDEFIDAKEKFNIVEFLEDNIKLEAPDNLESQMLNKELHYILCQEMSKVLEPKNYYIMQEVYFKDRSMASVGREIGMSRDAVRKRVLKSLNILKTNKDLQKIAKDYFGLES